MVAEGRRSFLMSSLLLIEILQNHFFRFHIFNIHTTLKFHRNSQVDLNMNKASNFAEVRRNRKIRTNPYDRILEAARIQVSSNTDVNVLLSWNNYLRFGITYLTGHFYQASWLWNRKKQAALIKSSKKVSAVLLGDSIIATFLRYPNIWYKFFDENTVLCIIVLWRVENIPLPQSLEYVVISCHTNNLDTNNSKKIYDGLFCIALALKKRMNHVKIVINGILPRDEQKRGEDRNYL